MNHRILSLLAAGLAVSLLSAPVASAADMGNRPVYTPTVAAPIYNWHGFYAGGNIGYGWGTAEQSVSYPGLVGFGIPTSFGASNSMNGFLGGVQAGYNWRAGSFLLGPEIGIQFGSLSGSGTGATTIFPGATVDTTVSADHKWNATVGGRLGYLVTERFLIFGEGGWAMAQINWRLTNSALGLPLTTSDVSKTSSGWYYGAGIEWMFAPNWSTSLTYRRLELDGYNTSTPFFIGSANLASNNLTIDQVKLGVNYHF